MHIAWAVAVEPPQQKDVKTAIRESLRDSKQGLARDPRVYKKGICKERIS